MQYNSFLLYGANGYTGALIARHAHLYHLQPILAGRRREVIEPLADKLQLPFRVFGLENTDALQTALQEVKVIIHAAGPFHHTARPMVEACLKTGTHYLDINGDMAVFEMIKQYDEAAKKAGIMLLPGAGFDVVPTDCIALQLKKMLPDAISLQLAFATLGGGLSHGTATTMVARLGEKGAERKEGKIIRRPAGEKGMQVDFGIRKMFVMSIPWGDVSTAYFSTGIPDIETYAGVPKKIYYFLKLQFLYNWLLRTQWMRNYIQKIINRKPAGPDDEKRSNAISLVWGRVKNRKGETATVRLRGPDGYTFTAHAALIIAKKVLQGNYVAGYQTPASAYHENLVLEIPGVQREVVR
jgi:short subunit dehydrogenase-like uncharacterized protein